MKGPTRAAPGVPGVVVNRYSPVTNWNDDPFGADVFEPTPQFGQKKKPPPRPPPPKVSKQPEVLAKPSHFIRKPTVLTSLLSRKSKTTANHLSATNQTFTDLGSEVDPNKMFPKCEHVNIQTGTLIDFSSPPSSPTFTTRSSSDGVSVDSFGSDATTSTNQHNTFGGGNASQAESGFEDDFDLFLHSRKPLSKEDTFDDFSTIDPFSPPVSKPSLPKKPTFNTDVFETLSNASSQYSIVPSKGPTIIRAKPARPKPPDNSALLKSTFGSNFQITSMSLNTITPIQKISNDFGDNVTKGTPMTKEEVTLLIDLVHGNKIITSKATNATNNRLKDEAWASITSALNASISSCPRTTEQLKLKWENLKKAARKRTAKIRLNRMKTGGGKPDYIPPDDALDRVASILGATCDGYSVPLGGDAEIVIEDKATVELPNELDSKPFSWDDEESSERESTPPMPTIPPPPPPEIIDDDLPVVWPEDQEFDLQDTMNNDEEPYAIALFDYFTNHPGDLCFNANSKIYLLRRENDEWMYGRLRRGLHEEEGLFPSNYVEIKVPLPNEGTPNIGQAIALYDFEPVQPGDLRFSVGDKITVLSKINQEWYFGECNGLKGQFPVNYVQMS